MNSTEKRNRTPPCEKGQGTRERLGRVGAPAGIYITAQVCGRELRFLYDTGASCTVISTSAWERLPVGKKPELQPSGVTLTTVGDHRLINRGSCRLEIVVDGRALECVVQVSDIAEEAVMGLDLISAYRCQWDWDRGVMRMSPEDPSPLEERCSAGHLAVMSGVSPLSTLVHDEQQVAELEAGTEQESSLLEMEVLPEVPWEEMGPEHFSQVWLDPSAGGVQTMVEGAVRGLSQQSAHIPQGAGTLCPDTGALPEHLRPLYDASAPYIDEELRLPLREMLEKYEDTFSRSDQDLGRTRLEVHRIPTGSARPVRLPPRRAPMHLRDEIEEQVQAMVRQGIVEECTSPWAAPLVIVPKKDGSRRICVDYRALNDVTEKDGHPIPRIGDSLDALAGATVFSTLDMTSGYHQVEVAVEDRDKTAFVTGRGHHLRYVTMPFGLCNAPSTFQRLMERVLQGLVWKTVVVYLDDVVVYSRTPEEHLRHLAEVIERFRAHNLKLKPRKCELFKAEVRYLGHVVSAAGVATDPALIEKVTKWEPPCNQKETRAFLGLAGYYRSYVPDYGDVAEPLVRLTDAKAEFKWTPSCQQAFEELKRRLTSAPLLAYPNREGQFILDTDASDVAIGAVLSQSQGEEEKVIAYGSKALSREERNYCVTRRELLAVVHFIEAYRYYLYGKEFVVRTDHSSLRWMLQQREPRDQLARWIQRLSPFRFVIQHRPGKKHGNADAMSRKCFRGGHCYHPQVESTDAPGTITMLEELQTAAESPPAPDQGPPAPDQGSQEAGQHPKTPRKAGVKKGKARKKTQAVRTVRRKNPGSDFGGAPQMAPVNGEAGKPSQGVPIGIEQAAVVEAQRVDPDLAVIRARLEAGLQKPSKEEVSRYSPVVKYWCARWNQLELKGGLLRYRWEPARENEPVQWKVVTPRALQELVLTHLHDLKAVGHLGVEKTWERAKRSQYLWAGMHADLERWVKRCQLCQQRKPPAAKKRAKLVTHQVGAPWERIAADVAGPFPTTKAGNKYILVVQDYFTKWVEIFAMPNQTAETVASLLVNEVFGRFGCCLEFHSDQGTNFESQVTAEVSRLFGVKKTRTSSYHPRGDGMVERGNRTLEAMIAMWVSEVQDDWDTHLPLLAMAYRSACHSTTGATPNLLNLGREVTLPVDLLMERSPDEKEGVEMTEYAERLRKRLQMAHDAAREHTTRQLVSQKRHYDQNVRLVEYQEGDVVWKYNPAKTRGRSFKLTRPWQGPFVIVKKLSDVTFRIRASPRGKPQIIHADRIKPCIGQKASDLGFEKRHFTPNACPAAAGGVCPALESQDCRTDKPDGPADAQSGNESSSEGDLELTDDTGLQGPDSEGTDDPNKGQVAAKGASKETTGRTNGETNGHAKSGENEPDQPGQKIISSAQGPVYAGVLKGPGVGHHDGCHNKAGFSVDTTGVETLLPRSRFGRKRRPVIRYSP